jgi:predicted nucleic acid-binding protein
MPMKINRLVDTNILVYAYNSQSVYHSKAMAFLQDMDIELYITSKNISEFFAVLTKQGEPFSKIFRFYEDIVYNSTILFPNQQSLTILENLLQKYQPHGNRVFDIEIVSIALANGINTVATINEKDFKSITEISLHSF